MVRKTPAAQLQREIDAALSKGKPRLHHASHAVVADEEGVDDDEIFEVAKDAFKEGDLVRAETLVGQMREPWVARCVEKTTHVVPKSVLSPQHRAKRTLYKLYLPMVDSFGTKHSWVVASAAFNPDMTLLFPATEDGKVLEYLELVIRHERDHDAVLKHQGYRVVECEKKSRKRRATRKP